MITQHQLMRERPGLGAPVTEPADPDPHLFHDLPFHGGFRAFSGFDKARQAGIDRQAAAIGASQKNMPPTSHQGDNAGRTPRLPGETALGTLHGPIAQHWLGPGAAAATTTGAT